MPRATAVLLSGETSVHDSGASSLALVRPGPVRRIDLVGVDEVPEGTMKMAYVDGTDQVLVVNSNGKFHALQGVCSHEYFELDKGFLTAGTLTCALHLSRFDLENGEPLDPPADQPLAVYQVVVENGRVFIEVPDGPLEMSQ